MRSKLEKRPSKTPRTRDKPKARTKKLKGIEIDGDNEHQLGLRWRKLWTTTFIFMQQWIRDHMKVLYFLGVFVFYSCLKILARKELSVFWLALWHMLFLAFLTNAVVKPPFELSFHLGISLPLFTFGLGR